jgi:hypothetical protein
MKTARFIPATKELFYFVSTLTMIRRHCETIEQAQQIITQSGIPQNLRSI